MPILQGLDGIRERHRGAVITIGNFDGVHAGHQKIIDHVRKASGDMGAKALAITFEPHPVKVLVPERGLMTLTPPDDKARLLLHYGVDYVLFINFTREFANLMPEDFIEDVLVERLGARAVVVGHRYAFGKGKRGTTGLLRRRGKKHGFAVRVVRNAHLYGDAVSSSRIRSLITQGRVTRAAELLRRPYSIHGTVIEGAGRGARLLDTPTANISTPNELVPKKGVYAVRATLGGRLLEGVANIGENPTFGHSRMSYEVHLFDFGGDLRGEELRLHFIKRIRGEKTFPNPDALKEQINADIGQAKEILKGKCQPIPF
jgi:riboflavin kinase/FMN adenylyltransferase